MRRPGIDWDVASTHKVKYGKSNLQIVFRQDFTGQKKSSVGQKWLMDQTLTLCSIRNLWKQVAIPRCHKRDQRLMTCFIINPIVLKYGREHGAIENNLIIKWSCYKMVLFIHSFISDISIAPLQVQYYLEALST